MLSTVLLFSVAIILLITSFIKDRSKTKEALKTSIRTGKNIVVELLAVLLLLGFILAHIPPKTISYLLGSSNKLLSIVYGALIGTVTIIPGVIAFPLSKELLEKGASLTALAAFITTLTMVGFVTVPVEIRHFGKKFTFYRNTLSFVLAIIIAIFMGVIL